MKKVSMPLGLSATLEFTSEDDGSNAGMIAIYTKPSYQSRRFTEEDIPVCYRFFYDQLKARAEANPPGYDNTELKGA